MKFYKIYPEVPAFFGDNTKFDRSVIPMLVEKLHIKFDGWLGSDIMELSPIFYVTQRLGRKLRNTNLSGIAKYDVIESEKSENFVEIFSDKQIPSCELLRINGRPFVDDFGLDKGCLIVSERANDLLHQFNLSGVDIVEVTSRPT